MIKILLIILPWFHYHSLSLESESNKRIGNEASTMSRLSNNRLIAHTKVMVYRACWPDQSVSKWNGLFSEGLLFHLLRAYCLGFDWSGWIVLIKSEILITMGMVWPVSSGKWKAPFSQHILHALPWMPPQLKVGGQSQQKRRPGRKNKLPKSFWPVKAEANALAWSCCPNERWLNTRRAPLRRVVSGNSSRGHTTA